ncbi:lysozyme inhibitor LprI family protein [Rhizobium sp. CNPSo 3464]|uniref:lysozyme inhibitor LprI family protein n=1 Tax=Rhizobium sp. CNPSo 3464 TaxID=3021406 RepID=UPI00254A94EA|nr:lysozyme inhibitor LprI family protein [Rhizobium sp. CNPSo 3464]MDK4743656.1 lysozyme inhibitor LprI family protein [Rhizobium sp. CNPSo 3464]
MNIWRGTFSRLLLPALALSIPTLVCAVEQKNVEATTGVQKQVDAVRPSYKSCFKQSEGVTVAMRDCAATELEYQDNRLNRAYRTLRAKLEQTSATQLRDEERAWIAERDRQCAVDKDGGTAALVVADDCLVQTTSKRAAELESRLPQ